MKIMIVISGYFPGKGYGGPPVSVNNFCSLMDNHDCYIITKNLDAKTKTIYKNITPNVWFQRNNCKAIYLEERNFNFVMFDQLISEIKPDLIYLQSFFQLHVIFCIYLAKKHNIALLLAPRGQFNANALSLKWYKKLPFVWLVKHSNLLDRVYYQSTSKEERDCIIKVLEVAPQKVLDLPNIPAIPKHKDCISKVKGYLKVCYAGRIVKNKNLLYALEVLLKAKCNITFDIYGIKEDEKYWQKCLEIIKICPKNLSVKYQGSVDAIMMSNLYEQYDCLISPTLFENFGHSIVEAMLHDTPVIISKGTTPWDNLADYNAGFVIPMERMEDFTKAVDRIGFMGKDEYSALVENLRMYCKMSFNLDDLKIKYTDALRNMLISKN